VCAAITLFGGIFYIIFCDAEMQKWAVNKPSNEAESIDRNEKIKKNQIRHDDKTRF